MSECKQSDIQCRYIPLICSAVYHINWLQAKAACDHWSEEVELLTYKFQWTVRFFQTKSNTWKRLHNMSMENGELSHACPKYTPGCGMNVRHSLLPILTVVVYNVFFPHISCAPQNYDSWDNGLPLSYCGICFFHICNMRVHKVSWWNWIYLLLHV